MSNFSFLQSIPEYAMFAPAAAEAERVYAASPAMCAVGCRKALELAVKWVYAADSTMQMPYKDNLQSLLHEPSFRFAVDRATWGKLPFLVKLGNLAVHTERAVQPGDALLSLRALFEFIQWVDYCYGTYYEDRRFNEAKIPTDRVIVDTKKIKEQESLLGEKDAEIEALRKEIEAMSTQLTAAREQHQQERSFTPEDIPEIETRKRYIDVDMKLAGWQFTGPDADVQKEYPVEGMAGVLGKPGSADYVLFGKDGLPLAVVEAKRTSKDPNIGRKQAVLYADCLERKFGRRPMMFTTNGFETYFWDDQSGPQREVSGIFSKDDLQKLMNRRTEQLELMSIPIDDKITDRYYQKEAIRAVCERIEQGFRKHLLVMATGSGKTRTVIALCDVLLRHGWVKNILFLADRNSLVTQAKRSFVNLLPSLSVTNLCEEKDNTAARCVFSTYQTMMNCIDSVKDEEGKLFTCGHFDLVICDEAHRSIYNKYRDIFSYFDAPLVGLTATPKDEIDKNTYEVFELENGMPTYGYELSQAVTDGFLVDFMTVATRLKFLEEGIAYDELSDEDKEAYERTFEDENGALPEKISSSALNEWVFNEGTIREVLHILMTSGLKIDYGEKLGKTIIFAKNHRHAEKILEIFGREYPHLPGYATVIDNQTAYAQDAIDRFSEPGKLPQIAISVDMLDTGIDVPQVLNLVFFKNVMSKAKFWQMIGRGTRLCPGLLDGADKEKFYIFDFCGNFAFFRVNDKGKPAVSRLPLQGALFQLKVQIAYKLQELACQAEELTAFRQGLVEDMTAKVRALNRENFAVRQHLRYVEKFSNMESYAALSYEDTLLIDEELAPLVAPDGDDPKAVRFDALMYGIELACLAGEKHTRARNDLLKKVQGIAATPHIPAIQAQSELIDKILHTGYLDDAGINEFEHIREALRDLAKYISGEAARYTTNFNDEILSMDWQESQLENDDLKNYRARAEFYVRQHQDEAVITKLRGNIPLSQTDVEALERILWSEVGSQEDYEAELGTKPLGEFVREIVGLDMRAAKDAFSEYLNRVDLDSRQIYFVNQIVEYIVHNGLMKDFSVLQGPPFTDQGSVVEVFTDLSVWLGIKAVIDRINANAVS